MPINPNILLAGRPMEVVDPNDLAQKNFTLSHLAQQNKATQMQLDEAEAQRQREAKMREAFASTQDPDKLISTVSAIDPKAGMALQTHFQKLRTDRVKSDGEAFDLFNKRKAEVGKHAASLLSIPAEQRQAQWMSIVKPQMLSTGLFKPEELGDDLPDEATLQVLGRGVLDPDKQQKMTLELTEEERKKAQEGRNKQEFEAKLPGMTADSRAKMLATAGQSIAGVSDQAGYDAWLQTQPEEMRKYWGPMYSPAIVKRIAETGMTAAQRSQAAAADATRTEQGRHNRIMESQGWKRIAQEADRIKADTNPQLVQAVLQTPELYDGLTPSAKTAIAPALAAAGFQGFGRQLSESAITKLSDARTAVSSLQDLREVLKNNEQYIGPISGIQSLNPWSDARKAQADIDRVKQRVGKALEGGVLRKEDEEKYKKILATLFDEPSTALYKVDQLIEEINRDRDIFIDEQRRAGRRVNTVTPSAPPAGSPGAGLTFKGVQGQGGGDASKVSKLPTDEILRRLANAGKSK